MDAQPLSHIRCLTGELVVTASWQAAKVGSSNLPSRKQVIIFNRSPRKIFWSFGSSSNVRLCNALKAGGYLSLNISEDVNVYLRSASLVTRVIVNEMS